ncbi:MAG: dolichyl-phosphate beta-glucosyltransferase [Blastocatellia bacterium]
MPFLSIVIPAFNEEKRIGRTLDGTFEYLSAQSYDYEVLVVSDGSRDRTAELVNQFAAQTGGRLRLIENPGNHGKGYSVRNGMLQAAGDIALFYDADLATPTTEIVKVVSPIVEDKYDVVFGSRALNHELIGTHQSFLRELRGRGGNLFLRATLGLDFRDTQCGFKAFRRETAQAIFKLQQIDGFGFDPEVLYIGKKQGWRLLELPVRWNHVEGSVVTLFGTTVKVLMEVSTIRWNDLTGKYNS